MRKTFFLLIMLLTISVVQSYESPIKMEYPLATQTNKYYESDNIDYDRARSKYENNEMVVEEIGHRFLGKYGFYVLFPLWLPFALTYESNSQKLYYQNNIKENFLSDSGRFFLIKPSVYYSSYEYSFGILTYLYRLATKIDYMPEKRDFDFSINYIYARDENLFFSSGVTSYNNIFGLDYRVNLFLLPFNFGIEYTFLLENHQSILSSKVGYIYKNCELDVVYDCYFSSENSIKVGVGYWF